MAKLKMDEFNQTNKPLLELFIESLRCLPGIGPKSAQRMAYHLLQHKRQQGLHLAQVINQALTDIAHCQQCNNFSEQAICHLCSDDSRDAKQLCIVENPSDITAIEQSRGFKGHYFVLMGCLSPLDGIGPNEIGIDKLLSVLQSKSINEIIFALNPSVEGEATLYYLSQMISSYNIKLSQLAHGVPIGSELEYLDCSTIRQAIEQRNAVEA